MTAKVSKAQAGSSASDKQIAHAVKDYRMVTFFPSGAQAVKGWVAGMDSYHWVVVEEDLTTILVHKSCPVVRFNHYTLNPDNMDEPLQERLRSFRQHILSAHFNHLSHDHMGATP